jgi:hypothetical protein
MIVLLVIAVAWLALLAVVLGMFHAATGTQTPRPVSTAAASQPGKGASRRAEPMPAEAA